MTKLVRLLATLSVAAAFAAVSAAPAFAKDEKFLDSKDAKQEHDPQTFLKDYDKLVKGKEADWVYFPEPFDAKAYKTVTIKEYGSTGGTPSRVRLAVEAAPGYWEAWLKKKDPHWEVVKSGGDLTIEPNFCNVWEPSGGARMWGGWYANPGAVQELIGKDKSGKTVFEIRHKSRGSTVEDAVENGIEKILETLAKGT
jgi:hypothetical protein